MKPATLQATSRPHLESALYEGVVTHARYGQPAHSFSYRTALCYLDMGELTSVLASHPLWSEKPWHPVQFRRSDYTGDVSTPLGESIRQVAANALGEKPAGPVRLLAHLRTWGWCFNPLALAFCFKPEGDALQAVVATVTNTPWGERHDYVLPARPDGTVDAWVQKRLHVSPYFPMGQHYRFRVSRPAERLAVAVDVYEGRRRVMAARLSLVRQPLGRRSMSSLVLRVPPHTWRVSAGIYWQAARLGARGATFHPHPRRAPLLRRALGPHGASATKQPGNDAYPLG